MMIDASRRKFEKVVVWSVDRIGRDMKHLVSVLSQMKDLNVDLYSYKQGIDTSTTMGSSFFHMVGIFAELENNMRRERQIVGIRRALDNGAKFGRNGLDNGWLQFNHVKVPHSAMLCKYSKVDPETGEFVQKGRKQLQYGALIGGRAIMVTDSAIWLKAAVTIAVTHTHTRA